MVETAMTTLRREIEELSEANRLSIETRNARINAANEEQIPRFFRPLRRLFRRTPNRAMAAILDEVAIAAEDNLSKIEYQNDIDYIELITNLANLLTSDELPKYSNGKQLSRQEMITLLKTPESLLSLLAPEEQEQQNEVNELGEGAAQQNEVNELGEGAAQQNEVNAQGEEAAQQNVVNAQGEGAAQPASLPKRRRRRKRTATEQAETAEQTETTGEAQADILVNDQGEEEQSDEVNELGEGAAQPATLPKRKRRRRKPTSEQAESLEGEQLPGQIEIEEINAENGEL